MEVTSITVGVVQRASTFMGECSEFLFDDTPSISLLLDNLDPRRSRASTAPLNGSEYHSILATFPDAIIRRMDWSPD